MDNKLSDLQKKQLEKVYARIFDQQQHDNSGKPILTEEGLQLCMEAGIHAEDLHIKVIDDFQKKSDLEEVA